MCFTKYIALACLKVNISCTRVSLRCFTCYSRRLFQSTTMSGCHQHPPQTTPHTLPRHTTLPWRFPPSCARPRAPSGPSGATDTIWRRPLRTAWYHGPRLSYTKEKVWHFQIQFVVPRLSRKRGTLKLIESFVRVSVCLSVCHKNLAHIFSCQNRTRFRSKRTSYSTQHKILHLNVLTKAKQPGINTNKNKMHTCILFYSALASGTTETPLWKEATYTQTARRWYQ